MAFKIHTRRASADRVPAVEEGEAIVYTRYADEKAVALNPADFHRLAQMEADLDVVGHGDRIPLDDLALEGLLAEARPSRPLEDATDVEKFLGL